MIWRSDRSIDDLRRWITTVPFPVLLDGGLSTQLGETDISGPLWTARAVLEQPNRVRQAHLEFLQAGAEVVITASYQISRMGFERVGYEAQDADAALGSSVRLAREAIAEAMSASTPRTWRREPLVAASVGPYGAILHDGSEYRGNYNLPLHRLRSFHLERLEVLAEAEPDLLMVETIPDLHEVEVLVAALAEFPHLAALISCTVRNDRQISAGQPIEGLADYASPQVLAIGVNCCEPSFVPGLLGRLRDRTDIALIAYPNAGGTWEASSEQWIAGVGGEPFVADWPFDISSTNARLADLIGGCCGTKASDIAELRRKLQPRSAPPLTDM